MRTLTRALAVGWIVATTTIAAVDEADACSCNEPDLPDVIPEDNATGVPTNTVIFCRAYQCREGEVALVDGAAVVEGEWGSIDTGPWTIGTRVFRPAAPLVPGRTYSLRSFTGSLAAHRAAVDAGDAEWADIIADQSSEISMFSVGEEADSSAPELPVVDVAGIEQGDCYDAEDDTCTAGPIGFHASVPVSHTGLVLLADFHQGVGFDPSTLEGEVGATWGGTHPLWVGMMVCGVPWPNIEAGEPLKVSFGSLSRTGQWSGWSEAIELEGAACWLDGGTPEVDGADSGPPPLVDGGPEPVTPPGSCTCGGGTPADLSLMTAVLVGARRRNHRRQGHSTQR